MVAASAVHYVAGREPLLPQLIDDIEWVSRHRAATHSRVSTAADWVLSARDPERAGAARDGLPVVALADRLGRIPIFEFVSVDELFRVIESGQEVRYAAGQAVGVEGATEAVELLIDGSVRQAVAPERHQDLPAPGVLGLEEVLQGIPTLHPPLANESCVCFRIRAEDFMAMVADDVRLAQGLFRLLLGADGRTNGGPVHLPAVTPPASDLQTFDKAMLVRQHPLLSRAAVGDLLALVGAARELSLWEGETLFRDDDAASLCLVLDGIVQLEADGDGPLVVGPGGMMLVAETLAGALPFAPWAAGDGMLNLLARVGLVLLWPLVPVLTYGRDPVVWLALGIVVLLRPVVYQRLRRLVLRATDTVMRTRTTGGLCRVG